MFLLASVVDQARDKAYFGLLAFLSTVLLLDFGPFLCPKRSIACRPHSVMITIPVLPLLLTAHDVHNAMQTIETLLKDTSCS